MSAESTLYLEQALYKLLKCFFAINRADGSIWFPWSRGLSGSPMPRDPKDCYAKICMLEYPNPDTATAPARRMNMPWKHWQHLCELVGRLSASMT